MQNDNLGGICGHSSKNATEHYIIFAVSDDTSIKGERYRAMIAYMMANSIGYKYLIGRWNFGPVEHSFIVNARNLDLIVASGLVDDQIAYIELGSTDARDRRTATLWHFNDSVFSGEPMGKIGQTTKQHAEYLGSYSYDPLEKTYFITAHNWS